MSSTKSILDQIRFWNDEVTPEKPKQITEPWEQMKVRMENGLYPPEEFAEFDLLTDEGLQAAKEKMNRIIEARPPEHEKKVKPPDPVIIPKLTIPDSFNIRNCKKHLPLIAEKIANRQSFHFVLTGISGSGKTDIAGLIMECSLVDYALVETVDVYNHYLDLCEMKDDAPAGEKKKLRETFTRRHIIIDDLGKEPNTEASTQYISGLLDKRYELLKRNPQLHTSTIITTNLTADEIKKRYGSRVFDRFLEHYKFLPLEPHSFRADLHKGV